MYKQKYIKVTITMDPTLLEDMKEYLKIVNSDKNRMHVSQSSFIAEAVKQLLDNTKS